MSSIHYALLTAASVILCAAPLSGQMAVATDAPPVATLATVTVIDDAPRENWFVRAATLRQAVIDLAEGNRQLAQTLRRSDEEIVRLQTRLDSLKRVDAGRRARLATLRDSISSTRARRQFLEARLAEREAGRTPPPE
jgi:hypothetical protein